MPDGQDATENVRNFLYFIDVSVDSIQEESQRGTSKTYIEPASK